MVFSHLRLQSQRDGNRIETTIIVKMIHGLVFPNCEIPKNVATVFGKDVIVVIIVRQSVTTVKALIEKLILLRTVGR